jgi:hypothetical protein
MAAQAVKRSGQHVTPNGGVHRPHPKRGLGDAFSDAIAEGMTRYVPGGVGILAIGIPTCALASFARFVLGVSPPATGAAGGAGAIAYVLKQIFHSI